MTTVRSKTNPCRSSSHLVGVAATFLLAALRAPLTAAQEDPPPWLVCGPAPVSANYTEKSPYQANINRLSLTLPKNVSSSRVLYATDRVGSVPDLVYALALCRGDAANASACESCVATAFQGAQQGCPLYKDVIIFYDLCQLRFSNRNFLVDDDYFANTYYLQGSQVVAMISTAFDSAVSLLVNTTAEYAVDNSSRRFGTGEEGFDDKRYPKIYALSQCTPDKTADVCRACLSLILGQLPKYFSGRNGGGVLGVWCSFRYEVYPFFSGRPLLQLPAFVATTPAPPPATKRREKTRNGAGLVLAIVMPIIAAVLAIIMICLWRRRSAAQSFLPTGSTSSDDIQGADMLLLDLRTLRIATEDFAESKMLGRGGFGVVYKILTEAKSWIGERDSRLSMELLEAYSISTKILN